MPCVPLWELVDHWGLREMPLHIYACHRERIARRRHNVLLPLHVHACHGRSIACRRHIACSPHWHVGALPLHLHACHGGSFARCRGLGFAKDTGRILHVFLRTGAIVLACEVILHVAGRGSEYYLPCVRLWERVAHHGLKQLPLRLHGCHGGSQPAYCAFAPAPACLPRN